MRTMDREMVRTAHPIWSVIPANAEIQCFCIAVECLDSRIRGNYGGDHHCICPKSNSEAGTLRTFTVS